jgi:hypothetical protein
LRLDGRASRRPPAGQPRAVPLAPCPQPAARPPRPLAPPPPLPPQLQTQAWNAAALLAADPLSNWVRADPDATANFYYCHHTFSHQVGRGTAGHKGARFGLWELQGRLGEAPAGARAPGSHAVGPSTNHRLPRHPPARPRRHPGQNLDNATYNDTNLQITLNNRVAASVRPRRRAGGRAPGRPCARDPPARRSPLRPAAAPPLRPNPSACAPASSLPATAPLLPPYCPPGNPQNLLNLKGKAAMSTKCFVSPQISGLMNGDALSALVKNGIKCGTGDNSWAHLRNLAKPHQMLYTTKVCLGGPGEGGRKRSEVRGASRATALASAAEPPPATPPWGRGTALTLPPTPPHPHPHLHPPGDGELRRLCHPAALCDRCAVPPPPPPPPARRRLPLVAPAHPAHPPAYPPNRPAPAPNPLINQPQRSTTTARWPARTSGCTTGCTPPSTARTRRSLTSSAARRAACCGRAS